MGGPSATKLSKGTKYGSYTVVVHLPIGEKFRNIIARMKCMTPFSIKASIAYLQLPLETQRH